MNTYNYEIIQLIITNQTPDKPDEVLKVLASVTATTPEGQSQTLQCSFEVFPTEGTTFVPFAEITEPMVRQWVDADVRQWSVIKLQLDTLIDQLAAPVLEPRPLPWVTPEPEVNVETTSSSTVMNVGLGLDLPPVNPGVSEEYLKALIYQVLEEIEAAKV